MVSTPGPVFESLSVALRRLFELVQLVELKLFFERLLGEFFSYRPPGHSYSETTDDCHPLSAFR